jgi:hypothetical protein
MLAKSYSHWKFTTPLSAAPFVIGTRLSGQGDNPHVPNPHRRSYAPATGISSPQRDRRVVDVKVVLRKRILTDAPWTNGYDPGMQ